LISGEFLLSKKGQNHRCPLEWGSGRYSVSGVCAVNHYRFCPRNSSIAAEDQRVCSHREELQKDLVAAFQLPYHLPLVNTVTIHYHPQGDHVEDMLHGKLHMAQPYLALFEGLGMMWHP